MNRIIQNLPSIKQSHLLHLFLTVLMNYSQFLTTEQVQSILLPFFSSFSSILSSFLSYSLYWLYRPDELGLRQHFLLVLYQFVKVHPSIIPQLHSFIHMESLEVDNNLLSLMSIVIPYYSFYFTNWFFITYTYYFSFYLYTLTSNILSSYTTFNYSFIYALSINQFFFTCSLYWFVYSFLKVDSLLTRRSMSFMVTTNLSINTEWMEL